jgi:hypothetical protein
MPRRVIGSACSSYSAWIARQYPVARSSPSTDIIPESIRLRNTHPGGSLNERTTLADGREFPADSLGSQLRCHREWLRAEEHLERARPPFEQLVRGQPGDCIDGACAYQGAAQPPLAVPW